MRACVRACAVLELLHSLGMYYASASYVYMYMYLSIYLSTFICTFIHVKVRGDIYSLLIASVLFHFTSGGVGDAHSLRRGHQRCSDREAASRRSVQGSTLFPPSPLAPVTISISTHCIFVRYIRSGLDTALGLPTLTPPSPRHARLCGAGLCVSVSLCLCVSVSLCDVTDMRTAALRSSDEWRLLRRRPWRRLRFTRSAPAPLVPAPSQHRHTQRPGHGPGMPQWRRSSSGVVCFAAVPGFSRLLVSQARV